MHDEHAYDLEADLLIEALYRRWGHDLRGYARASLRRRIAHVAVGFGAKRPSELIPRLLDERDFFELFSTELLVSVTEMFRDPTFFAALRTQVLPDLASYPRPAIWHAGCASGEEVYSLAILLHEAGLLDRVRVYGTDASIVALRKAKAGIYPLASIEAAEAAYRESGGGGHLTDHVTASGSEQTPPGAHRHCIMAGHLRNRVTWSYHNLVCDGPFAEVNLVVCRNTMIYFDQGLQNDAVRLFARSLVPRGWLALGTKESLARLAMERDFRAVNSAQRIYLRRYGLRHAGEDTTDDRTAGRQTRTLNRDPGRV